MYDPRFCRRHGLRFRDSMAYLKRFLVLALACSLNVAFAGYAQLKPPQGWSAGVGASVPGQAGTFNYGAAANGTTYVGGTVRTNAALAVAGQVVTMPASMRLAANAATVAATFSFGNPLLFATLAAGTLAYNYFTESGYRVEGGIWVEDKTQRVCAGPCFLYSIPNMGGGWFDSIALAGADAARRYTNPFATVTFNGCPSGTDYSSCSFSQQDPNSGSVSQFSHPLRVQEQPSTISKLTVPAVEAEFIDVLGKKTLPIGLPDKLNTPLPVLPPVFNPDPAIAPQPAPAPQGFPRPLFIPTGNPVPTADPNVWNQPGVRVSPAPTPDMPWRVDVVPENVSQPIGTPKTAAELNPSTPIAPGTPTPETPQGLCDQYPDILACQKVDAAPTPDALDTKDKAISITPDAGWGGGAGSCPAGRALSHGAVYSFQPVCDFATGVRPVLIAVAWLAAGLILIGSRGGAD